MKDLWAIVEVMGHSQYAGRVSEFAELGVPLIRVEIPETDGQPACEKLLGAQAIFRITPCTEEAARKAVGQLRVNPLAVIGLPSVAASRPLLDDYDDDEDLDP